MKIKNTRVVEFTYIESENGHQYRRSRDDFYGPWEWLNNDGVWVHFDDNDLVEESYIEYLNNYKLKV